MSLAMGAFLSGCSGNGKSTTASTPAPQIQNINSSTTPTSPISLPVEINGSNFQATPGKVTFTQGNISVDVTPTASTWSDTGIVAVVPAGNGTTNFTVPGTVNVTVGTSGGTSNAVTINLVGTFTFNPSAMGWSTTMPLPKALTGLRAVAVPGASSTSAFAVVTGGFDGTANTKTVWVNNLNQDGTVGSTTNTAWTTISTNPLPTTLAHHAMAEADDTNSPVSVGKRFVYVIGGQVNATDLPGGTSAIYMASVDSTTGALSTWTTLTNPLPKSLLGMSAIVHNGYLYVAGGLDTNGNPVASVYSAPVNSDGTIGTWTTATNSLLTPRSFGEMFVFGGNIYFVDGDPVGSNVAPNLQSVGDKSVYFATAVRGAIGTWTPNGNSTIHNTAKGLLFVADGQVISGEGVYTGSVGSGEMETSTVNGSNTSNSALTSFNGLTGSTAPKANVYNAAGLTSPIVTSAKAPRFMILGGQALTGTTGPGGALSNTVYYNNMP